MALVRVSRLAQSDLTHLTEYLAREAGPQVAIAYAKRIRASVNLLASFPGMGAPRPDFGPDDRIIVVSPYLIFYDGGPKAEHIDVLRILHERQNITNAMISAGRD